MDDQDNKVLRFDLPKNSKYKALLLDDDPMFCSTLKSYGKKKNIEIITSQSIGDFLSNLGQTSTDILIIDFKLQEETTGLDIVKFLAGSSPMLLVSGNQTNLKPEDSILPKYCYFIAKDSGPKAIIDKATHLIESASWLKPNLFKSTANS